MLHKFPALIDCHVHFREPGLTHKGDMESESAAALSGGVGTVCEMPNTVPPTCTIAALADKVGRAKRIQNVDVRFFFGVTEMVHLAELRKLWTDPSLAELKGRCCGVKIYLDHSTGNQKVEEALLADVFRICAELGIVLVGHCEDAEINAQAMASVETPYYGVSTHSRSRPPESEARAIERCIVLSRTHGTHFHVAHLSIKEGVELVRDAKREGLHITCEVTPHHLFLTTDDEEALGTLAKMNPPLRTHEHQDALWKGIEDRTIDCVATDHAPHTLEGKRCADPLKAPSGVPGVATMLPLLLTVASGKWPSALPSPSQSEGEGQGGAVTFTYEDIIRLCFENPNQIFSLGKDPSSPQIEVDLDAQWTIHAADIPGKCGWTPYEGWKVRGKVRRFVV